ncbi:MAG: hypothetical protein WA082_04425 [Candidatus Moraniibacteriota bacterium]
MPKGYTTRAKIENYLLIDIDSSFHDQVDAWIEEVEAYIDTKTGRNFVADPEESGVDAGASTRRFDGDGTNKQIIDDCVEVTSVKLSDEDDPLELEDYVLYPANAQALSRPVPYTLIRLLSGAFPSYPPQGIYVKARWGYSELAPKDIQTVATVLVAGIINYSWNAEGEVKSESIGRYSVTYKDDAGWKDFERIEPTLASYIKYSF